LKPEGERLVIKPEIALGNANLRREIKFVAPEMEQDIV